MKHITTLKNKKVLVLGLAKSGFSAAKMLHELGAIVTVNDFAKLQGDEHATTLRNLGVEVIGGGHPEEVQNGDFDLVVKNPGIPYTNVVIEKMIERNIPIWTEVELAYLISEAPIVGITGSNGKTTTTTLLYHLLNIDGKQPLIAGNIGTVATDVAEHARADQMMITELSSFQLMGIEQFRPHIAILTNLYEAHLDYHGTKERYIEAKANLFKNQTAEDFLIYNADQEEVVRVAEQTEAQLYPFSRKRILERGMSADDEMIYWNGEPYLKRALIKIPGDHNLENVLAATAAALLMDCSKETVEDVLSSFTGVKHRMQFVLEKNGIKFYNDSKATNTLATKSALQSFKNAPILLIAGGLERGHSFEELRPYMDNVKAVITFGETRRRFAQFAEDCQVPIVETMETMEEGVARAMTHAEKGDVVLLSPSCASWDQYGSFELRGEAFIDAVMKLTK